MEKILSINNLVKRYAGAGRNAVDDVSFDIYKGELFALLGVNGAGKSTLINIICTLIEKTSGEVWVDGNSLAKNKCLIRKSIGVVFQGNVLDDMLSAEENLICRASFYGMSPRESKKRIASLAVRLSMRGFLKSPYGKLSGGQRRKCDIARALIAEPKILFLDEPTTGLDPRSRIELWDTIEEIRQKDGMTVLLTTHYMEETESADRAAIIDGGRLLCLDTPQMLKTKYSSDELKLIVKPAGREPVERFLKENRLSGEFHVDTFSLRVKSGLCALELLPGIREYLDSIEIRKGNMDSVFINVVGRTFEHE